MLPVLPYSPGNWQIACVFELAEARRVQQQQQGAATAATATGANGTGTGTGDLSEEALFERALAALAEVPLLDSNDAALVRLQQRAHPTRQSACASALFLGLGRTATQALMLPTLRQ